MVLLVGHLMFDGEIAHGVCRYHNRNLILIERIERFMREVYDYPPKRRLNEKTEVHSTGYYNVALAKHLREKAEELVREISRLSLNHKREFLRAFFDDEGCMDFAPPKLRRVRGYQKDVAILELVKELLADFGIEGRVVAPNEVVIRGKENLIRFEREIGFSSGVAINGNRSNSRWKESLEKQDLLRRAITSFKL